MRLSIVAGIVFCSTGVLVLAQSTSTTGIPEPLPDLTAVHKVFIEKMPDGLDVYLRAEFGHQFKVSEMVVVSTKESADAIISENSGRLVMAFPSRSRSVTPTPLRSPMVDRQKREMAERFVSRIKEWTLIR